MASKKIPGTLKNLFWKAQKLYPLGFQKPRRNFVSLFYCRFAQNIDFIINITNKIWWSQSTLMSFL